MYEKEFDKFGNILQIKNFEELCYAEYEDYIDTIIEFSETKTELLSIYERYKNSILKMIFSDEKIKDYIMTEKNRTIRHDKKIEETVDIQKITDNIFEKKDNLNYFEERARTIILLEIAKLINCYGMEELNSNQEKITKEITLGIFTAKTNRYLSQEKLEKTEQRINLEEAFGEESIPYIENYELLKQRIQSLINFTKDPKEMQELDLLIKNLSLADKMIEKKDKELLPLLKQCYTNYEKINRQMLLSRLNSDNSPVINNPDDKSLLLLHFIPTYDNEFDFKQAFFFDKMIQESIKKSIEEKYGREYDDETDAEETKKMVEIYMQTRKKPFNLNLRIPLKNRYTNNDYYDVITAPHTNLSCSICKIGALHPHLNRKIAIAFSTVPIDAIKTINRGYNNELDRFSFQRNSVAIPEVLKYIEKGGTNETLVDWTKIEPAYIVIIKDTEQISEHLLTKAQEYNRTTGLPIRIYDAYEIEKRKNNPELNTENGAIEGAYTIFDLEPFSQIKSKGNFIQNIKNKLKFKELGGSKNEHSI